MTRLAERMDHGFAVFNLHLNKAGERADKEFIDQFGQECFDQHIKPHHESGIMVIFHKNPTIHTQAWVSLVTAYVNENAGDNHYVVKKVSKRKAKP